MLQYGFLSLENQPYRGRRIDADQIVGSCGRVSAPETELMSFQHALKLGFRNRFCRGAALPTKSISEGATDYMESRIKTHPVSQFLSNGITYKNTPRFAISEQLTAYLTNA